MQILNKSFIIIISVILLSVIACHKKKCEKTVTKDVMLPTKILDFVDFKQGSYWIWYDSLNFKTDCVVVLNSRHYMENNYNYNDCYDQILAKRYENIEMVEARYDSLGNMIYTPPWVVEFSNLAKTQNNDPDTFFGIYGSNQSLIIGYPFQNYKTYVSDLLEYFTPEMEVNGEKYFDILNIRENFNGSGDFHNFTYYSRKIGVIKVTGFNNGKQITNRYLLRYKIT